MRQLIRERHAALFAELLADMVGQLMPYPKPSHRPPAMA